VVVKRGTELEETMKVVCRCVTQRDHPTWYICMSGLFDLVFLGSKSVAHGVGHQAPEACMKSMNGPYRLGIRLGPYMAPSVVALWCGEES